jgi:hypothetical protein
LESWNMMTYSEYDDSKNSMVFRLGWRLRIPRCDVGATVGTGLLSVVLHVSVLFWN